MKMIDVKMTPAEKAEYTSEVKPEAPEYPYGLRLCLDKETLEKLGITELPALGAMMELHAMVEVVSVSQYESDNSTDRSVNLQIKQMGLEPSQGDPAKQAAAMFPSSAASPLIPVQTY